MNEKHKSVCSVCYLQIFSLLKVLKEFVKSGWGLGIGDWGLGMGIGDWAQSPIPNPQSPIPNPQSPIP